jgi:nucleoside-diphosphate-sugar epimerase
MRVFVAGASGAIGRQLVPLLLSAGHSVAALARSDASAAALREAGVEPLRGDALDREAVVEAVGSAAPDAVVHQLTALPANLTPRGMAKQLAPTNRLRREGTANLIAAAEAASVRRLVAQSIAFAYAPRGERVEDEDAPLNLDAAPEFRATIEAVAELERQVTEFGGVVLRYGYFYGAGTAYADDGSYPAMVRRRAFPIVGSGDGVFSFVHVRDAAEATVAALDVDGPAIFNVTDDEPAPVREWVPELARVLGAKSPRRVPAWLARPITGKHAVEMMTEQRGASNVRAREQLGWTPSHPSWREGFRSELGGAA